MNSSSVHVSMLRTGCCKVEFDSTYRIRLNGIIDQDEFRESISEINRTISSNTVFIFFVIIFGLSVSGGMILFYVGGKTGFNSQTFGSHPSTDTGVALAAFGLLFVFIGCWIMQSQHNARMRKAIAQESIKYSSRLPTPCSWRSETTAHFVVGHVDERNIRVDHYLVIEIGCTIARGSGAYYFNQPVRESTLFFGQRDDYILSPYSETSAGFCSRCDVSWQDSTDKFCSSCGHSFDKN